MGAALDSFVITFSYGVIVAITLLILCLISRHRNNSGNLKFFERMPLLLPAIGFVFTIMLVANMGITPIAQFQGFNSSRNTIFSGYETDFTIRDEFMYTGYLHLTARYPLEINETAHVELSIYQNSISVDTLVFEIDYSPTLDSFNTNEGEVSLAPGSYQLELNYTIESEGVPIEEPVGLQITISQPLIEGFTNELVDWSSLQFGFNVICIVLILAGLCFGSPTKTITEDETDWKTTTEYEY